MATWETFLALPPTPPPVNTTPSSSPPKDTTNGIEEALDFLDTSFDSVLDSASRKSAASALHTPPTSSPLVLDDSEIATLQSRKRIRFSTEVKFCDEQSKPYTPGALPPILKILPASREQKPSRPILKAATYTSTTEESGSHSPSVLNSGSFADMLRSVLQQLGSSDLISRRSAYLTISSSISAYENILPNPNAFNQNQTLFEQYVQRDMALIEHDASRQAKDVALQAAKFAEILILKLSEDRPLSDKFGSFIIDRCLLSTSSAAVAKDIALNHVQLLTLRGPYKAMTPDRSRKLLFNLFDVHKRVSGENIKRLRLSVFQRNLHYFPAAFLDSVKFTLPLIFEGFLSRDSRTRIRSIDIAHSLGSSFPYSGKIAQHTERILGGKSNGQSYLKYFCEKIKAFIADHDTAVVVPQIWSAVMLLASGKESLLLTMLNSASWLPVAADCFNNRSHIIALSTWEAWDVTVFATANAFDRSYILKRILQPVIAHLQRRAASPRTEAIREQAIANYRLLLYHAFCPPLRGKDLVQRWTVVVQEPIEKISRGEDIDTMPFLQMLSAILFESDMKFSNVRRGLKEDDRPLTDKELPRLEASWIRANFSLVLKTVKVLLEHNLGKADPRADQLCLDTWHSFMKAVSNAGSKEVTTTIEFRKTIAELTNFVCNFVHKTPDSVNNKEIWAVELLSLAIGEIGPAHFAEDFLAPANDGQVEASPSRAQHKSNLRSPVASIIGALVTTIDTPHDYISNLTHKLSGLLDACLPTIPTVESRTKCLRSCLTLRDEPIRTPMHTSIWQLIVSRFEELLIQAPARGSKDVFNRGCIANAFAVLELGSQLSDDTTANIRGSFVRELFAHIKRCEYDDIDVATLAEQNLLAEDNSSQVHDLSMPEFEEPVQEPWEPLQEMDDIAHLNHKEDISPTEELHSQLPATSDGSHDKQPGTAQNTTEDHSVQRLDTLSLPAKEAMRDHFLLSSTSLASMNLENAEAIAADSERNLTPGPSPAVNIASAPTIDEEFQLDSSFDLPTGRRSRICPSESMFVTPPEPAAKTESILRRSNTSGKRYSDPFVLIKPPALQQRMSIEQFTPDPIVPHPSETFFGHQPFSIEEDDETIVCQPLPPGTPSFFDLYAQHPKISKGQGRGRKRKASAAVTLEKESPAPRSKRQKRHSIDDTALKAVPSPARSGTYHDSFETQDGPGHDAVDVVMHGTEERSVVASEAADQQVEAGDSPRVTTPQSIRYLHPAQTPRSFIRRFRGFIQDVRDLVIGGSQEEARLEIIDLGEVLRGELAKV